MKNRKLSRIVLFFVLAFTMLIPASAANAGRVFSTQAVGEGAYSGNVDEITMDLSTHKSDVNGTVETVEALPTTINNDYCTYELQELLSRGTSTPENQWNFSDGWYQGHVSGMCTTSFFTNYTFQPNSSGELILQSTFSRAYESGCTVRVDCYNASTKRIVTTTEYPTNFNDTAATAMKFTGLDKNSTYYFKFTAVYSSSN